MIEAHLSSVEIAFAIKRECMLVHGREFFLIRSGQNLVGSQPPLFLPAISTEKQHESLFNLLGGRHWSAPIRFAALEFQALETDRLVNGDGLRFTFHPDGIEFA